MHQIINENLDCNGVTGRGWRRMPVIELEDLITAIRRAAVHQHFTPSQWALVDRMRSRAAKLRRAGQ